MNNIGFRVEEVDDEYSTQCACCGRAIHWGHGCLLSGEQMLAAYWYQWADGHEGRFGLALARSNADDTMEPGIVSISALIDQDNISHLMKDADDDAWPQFLDFFNENGGLLDRQTVLQDASRVFSLVDAIAANDARLVARILKTIGYSDS